MEEDLLRITPDKEKARSILRMVNTTLEMVKNVDKAKFPSNIVREYYEVVRELTSIILLLDGYKTTGEGAHKKQVEYMEAKCKEFGRAEIVLIDELRVTRNKIAYDGFFVTESYLDRKLPDIINVIEKLRVIIKKRLD